MTDKVVFAEYPVTVHRVLSGPQGKDKLYTVESVNLLPGETFPFDELPKYQQDAILNNEVKGLRYIETEEVKRILDARDVALAMATPETIPNIADDEV